MARCVGAALLLAASAACLAQAMEVEIPWTDEEELLGDLDERSVDATVEIPWSDEELLLTDLDAAAATGKRTAQAAEEAQDFAGGEADVLNIVGMKQAALQAQGSMSDEDRAMAWLSSANMGLRALIIAGALLGLTCCAKNACGGEKQDKQSSFGGSLLLFLAPLLYVAFDMCVVSQSGEAAAELWYPSY
eukprot:TRINITY_DN100575_c0_g1_i1.p3 TRINITY_DN100575_c0_g1~~TRINITY_DN100575_c0_g1_i1.p3  ORF type:complete len:190 (+),score=69.84 TRINITY_DN100575_c0_g1_i1:65-634(+)